MAISDDERERRRQHVGSSDIAALFGLDPKRDAARVYYEKLPQTPERVKRNDPRDMGRLLEGLILTFGEEILGLPLERDVWTESKDHPVLCANLDARGLRKPEIGLEAKYTTLVEEWGAEGTDEVPFRVALQAQHQMVVAGLELVWVPVMFVRYRAELRLYRIDPMPDVQEMIVEEAERFWREHVLAGVPPPGGEKPPLDVLKRLRRDIRMAQGSVEAAVAWDRLREARQMQTDAHKLVDETMADVLGHFGTADAMTLPDGRILRYPECKSPPSVDHVRFKAIAPTLYADVVHQGTHRVLREDKRRARVA